VVVEENGKQRRPVEAEYVKDDFIANQIEVKQQTSASLQHDYPPPYPQLQLFGKPRVL
jgi:hypothetical protein